MPARLSVIVVAAVVLSVFTGQVAAGRQPRKRQVRTADKKYVLQVIPSKKLKEIRGDCQATLFRIRAKGGRRPVWTRKLVNEKSPQLVFLAPNASCVITIDEWDTGGRQNTLVLYGDRGQLIRHHTLDDLLNEQERKQLPPGNPGKYWRKDARFGFSRDLKYFLIRLQPATSLYVKLENGDVLRKLETEEPVEWDYLESEYYDLVSLPGEEGQEQALAGLADEDAVVAQSVSDFPAPDPRDLIDYAEYMELLALNRLGTDENAADYYEFASDYLTSYVGDDEAFDAALKEPWTEEQFPDVNDWLNANVMPLENFVRGSTLEKYHARYQYDDGDLIMMRLPALAPIRGLSKASVMESNRLLAHGQAEEAFGLAGQVIRAGAHQDQGFTLIERLVGASVRNLAYKQLARIAASESAQSMDFSQAAQQLAESDPPIPDFSEATEFERLFFKDVMQRSWHPDPETGELTFDVERLDMFAEWTGWELDPQERESAESLDHEETYQAGMAFYDRMSQYMRQPYHLTRDNPPDPANDPAIQSNPLLREVIPNLTRCRFAQARSRTLQSGTHTLYQVKAFEQANGRLPDSLDELSEGAASHRTDPFSGRDLIYERTEDGFRLYSTGPDGVDGGGAHDNRCREGGDYVFWPVPE